jgi:3-hydroxyisobutyrate dehydrogenase-like beta-hydroxyacid dehydrogenase
MGDISVIGLGLMGSALARPISAADHSLVVWHKTSAKAEPFARMGAQVAATFEDATHASPIILMCIDSYASSNALLQSVGAPVLLKGKTFVQLTSGVPRDAIETEKWMQAHGVHYLDGAILAGPGNIGTDQGHILLSGSGAAYDNVKHVLKCLGRLEYLGSNVKAAIALDLAWLSTCYGRFISMAQGINICQAEGVELNKYVALFPDRDEYSDYLRLVRDGQLDQATATLNVWHAALRHIQHQGRDAGISTRFPDLVADYLKTSIEAGHGDQNVISFYPLLSNRA